ncbi:hypothetical protein LF1_14300 [Rubripirellula obstinata]|uniref:Squalene cyclase C-terminal domain-containing protein n=1 Tax=Rubripirellula obstinata TaxID=406547 RepID=A0A5B1CEA1_9BACT|nr:prenyltransferase/squalene oxidase repeat-containing protein [Rubripirellula obstinata]KAA1258906.1 hypothetical protein LF1_14300 [Rubripirellula obstinata]
MTDLWADERLVYAVAVAAVATLVATVWLFRRQQKAGRGAAFVCLILAIGLHAALLFLVPMIDLPNGGTVTANPETEQDVGMDSISFSTFDPNMELEQVSADGDDSSIAPLPIDQLTDLLADNDTDPFEEFPLEADDSLASEDVSPTELEAVIPETLASEAVEQADADAEATASMLDDALGELFDDAFAVNPPEIVPEKVETSTAEMVELTAPKTPTIARGSISDDPASVTAQSASAAMVPGAIENDFAARVGDAKYEALHRTGGDENTEAAVEAALKFLASNQRDDGGWDPAQSGAGRELAPLGMTRAGAGTKSDTALTGLSLLALLGAGQTHQEGDYADNVYRGLANLIRKQSPDGSLAGNATIYAANYAHGMAALSLSEAAVITRDPSAVASATRAVSHSLRMQHPTTGGWRYTRGDPGDLSQLGWQAMVIDAGFRAGVTKDKETVAGITRFLRSVRAGSTGGLASYRPREAPSRTMTAEALATRLLIGEKVPQAEIREAETYLLQKLPGVGQDDYYYWYYATLALHQLQDDAWRQWNDALKTRLLATQRADGSWPADTVWGGYGGTVYTTAMATLCLEAYYRHTIRGDVPRVAERR